MAWVRPKPKPRKQDPAEAAESLRPLLQFFSAGHTPKPAPRSSRLLLMPPPPAQRQSPYDCAHAPARHETQIVEVLPEEEVNDHAFSFSRDRLVPLAPKKLTAPKRGQERRSHQPLAPYRPSTRHERETSPPPPPKQELRPVARHARPPSRHYATAETSRVSSSRWESATTPLRL